MAAALTGRRFEVQPGDADPTPFSFRTKKDHAEAGAMPYRVHHGGDAPHYRENVHRSPMYSGQIQSIGPRYCPASKTRSSSFRTRHAPAFLEPEGLNTHEIYVNGMSTSLPIDVQWRLSSRFRDWKTRRCCGRDMRSSTTRSIQQNLSARWRRKRLTGCFSPGQINGTSGYEEAACQGIMAGINAALKNRKASRR